MEGCREDGNVGELCSAAEAERVRGCSGMVPSLDLGLVIGCWGGGGTGRLEAAAR